MEYLQFKKKYEDAQKKSSIVLGGIEANRYKNLLFLLQGAFDKNFNELSQKNPKDLPIWLFELFDEFVKLIEHQGKSLSTKLNDVLNLIKDLHKSTFLYISPVLAQQLFKTHSDFDNKHNIAA